MTEDDTFEKLRRPSYTEMKHLHGVFMDSNKEYISLEMSMEFFKGHGWNRAEYVKMRLSEPSDIEFDVKF